MCQQAVNAATDETESHVQNTGFCSMLLASYNNKQLRFIPQAQIVLTGITGTF